MKKIPKLDPVKFGIELSTILKDVFPVDVRYSTMENAIYVESVKIEICKSHCNIYQNDELIFSFPGSFCNGISGYTGIALYVNNLIGDVLKEKGPF